MAELKLDDATQRRLFLLMHECLGCDPAFASDSQQMLLRYLATFNAEGRNFFGMILRGGNFPPFLNAEPP